MNDDEKLKIAYELLQRAGYKVRGDLSDRKVIIVSDPVRGYDDDGKYGIVTHNDVRIYGYQGTSVLAAAIRFIDERS